MRVKQGGLQLNYGGLSGDGSGTAVRYVEGEPTDTYVAEPGSADVTV